MSMKRKGWLFEFPLIAKKNSSFPNGVEICPDPAGPNAHHWDATTNSLTFNKFSFNGMKKVDLHYVEFILDDRTQKDLRFPYNPQDAMWVVNGTTCPASDANCKYDTVVPLAVIGGETLLVINVNGKGKKLSFRLNFVEDGDDDTDPSNYYYWDPIINNRDGGI